MPNPVSISFSDGVVVQAATMNSLVSALNNSIAELNALTSRVEGATLARELVRAYKATQQDIVSDGSLNVIRDWTAEKNVGTLLNPSTGLITIAETGIYRIEARAFSSVDNATRIRTKLSIAASGAELGKAENNSYGTPGNISNYRQDLYAFAQTSLNVGTIVSARLQVWDAATGRIPVENNYDTFLAVSRIY